MQRADDRTTPREESGIPHAHVEDARADTQIGEPVWVGRAIDERYRITAALGEGGMGAVYVAEHLKLHKLVALKVIRPELAGIGDVAARFAREAMAVARFEHPNVASAIDYGTLPEGGAYLVMQLVQGHSLRRVMDDEGALDWRRVCALGAQVADALAAAKAQGIIHRDLKPENLMIERRDDGSELVKILDFGIARITAKDESAPEGAALTRELTRVGTVVGTPGYMAPEQAIGDVVDHRVDLYALGVVLWEALTGEELWDAPDFTTIVTRQLSETVPSVRERMKRSDIPAQLDTLISQLLARKAEERPDSPGEVRDTLRRLAFSTPQAWPNVALPTLPTADGMRWLQKRWAHVRRTWQGYPDLKRIQVAVGGVLLMAALAGWIGIRQDGDADAPANGPAVAATQLPSKAISEASAPAAPEAKRSLPEKVSDAIQKIVRPAEPEVPAALRDDVERLLESRRKVERRKAADKLLAHDPQSALPDHVKLVARFEASRTCKDRNDVIDEMGASKDVRVLPTLRRLHEAPPRGCGFLSLTDCYACLRPSLGAAVDKLSKLETPKD